MDPDELPPRHGLLALGSRWDAMAFEDVADRLVADRIAQVGQGPHDAVIAPRAILPGHPHHHIFDLLVNARTPNRLRELGDIIWKEGEFAVPGQYGVRLGHCGNLLKRLLAQLYADLGKGLTIAITELYTTRDLGA